MVWFGTARLGLHFHCYLVPFKVSGIIDTFALPLHKNDINKCARKKKVHYKSELHFRMKGLLKRKHTTDGHYGPLVEQCIPFGYQYPQFFETDNPEAKLTGHRDKPFRMEHAENYSSWLFKYSGFGVARPMMPVLTIFSDQLVISIHGMLQGSYFALFTMCKISLLFPHCVCIHSIPAHIFVQTASKSRFYMIGALCIKRKYGIIDYEFELFSKRNCMDKSFIINTIIIHQIKCQFEFHCKYNKHLYLSIYKYYFEII